MLPLIYQAEAEGAKATEKLARTMRSTAQTVIKQAQTEKQRERLIVEHIKMRQKELAVERKKATLDTVKIKALEDLELDMTIIMLTNLLDNGMMFLSTWKHKKPLTN